MATGATETGGFSTATETGNLEMSTKSNIIPEILPASEVLPTSEIGSSSTANVDENLVIDIRKMFERQAILVEGEGLGMISVPDHLRKLDEQAFTPMLISIGPIHLSNVKLQSTKRYKVQFCESFLRWTKMDLKDLVGCIRSCEKEIRSYYAETIISSISSDDFVTMILVDATFILGYFYKTSYLPSELDSKIPDWMHPFLKLDMVLLENQLPFSILEMLFKKATSSDKLKTESLLELATEFFQCYNFQKISPEKITARIENFTDLVRLFHLNVGDLPKRGSGRSKLPYSATQLHEAGVKFKGVKFDKDTKTYGGDRHFLDLKFNLNNGVLEIPCITLDAEKIRLIRNISALEQSLYVGHTYVTDFFVILDFLIDTSKDIDLLCDEGILVNYLGNSKAAALAINELNSNILWDYINSYSKICEDLNIFYKKPWHRWRATLWRQYFSTPWRAASTSAAIILLLLTAIQSVCSVKSTKW